MVLSFTNGNVTTNGTEQTVWNITADKHFAGWLFLNNMGANEVISVQLTAGSNVAVYWQRAEA